MSIEKFLVILTDIGTILEIQDYRTKTLRVVNCKCAPLEEGHDWKLVKLYDYAWYERRKIGYGHPIFRYEWWEGILPIIKRAINEYGTFIRVGLPSPPYNSSDDEEEEDEEFIAKGTPEQSIMSHLPGCWFVPHYGWMWSGSIETIRKLLDDPDFQNKLYYFCYFIFLFITLLQMTTKKKNGSRLPLDVLKIVLDFAIRDKYDFKILSRVSRSWKRLADEIGKTKRRKMTIPEYITLKLKCGDYTEVVVYEWDDAVCETMVFTTCHIHIWGHPVFWKGIQSQYRWLKGQWHDEDHWYDKTPLRNQTRRSGSWDSFRATIQHIIDEGLSDEKFWFFLKSDTSEQHTLTGHQDVPSLQKQLDDPEFQNKLFFL